MQGGIEGRLLPESAERCDRSIRGKKRGDISDLSPAENKWINPSYRNHSSWLRPSNAKLHYTETTAARCVPHLPCALPSSPAFVFCTALYYPWWKYNLPLICVPKPYKSKSSKVATFLHRYYVSPPTATTFNQKRLITRVLDWHLLLLRTWEMGWGKKSNWGMTRKGERVWGKIRKGDNIVKLPLMTAEQCGRESTWRMFFSLLL